MLKANLLFLILISSVTVAFAQQLKFKKGGVFNVKTSNTEKTDAFNSQDEYTFLFKVLSAEDNVYRIQCHLAQVKLNISGKNFNSSLNSDNIRKTEFNNYNLIMPLILLQKNFVVNLNNKGAILKIEGYNELVQQAIKQWQLSPQLRDWVLITKKDLPNTILKKIFFELPKHPIIDKYAWTSDSTSYKVTERSSKLVKISAINTTNFFNGEYILDAANALPLQTTTIQTDKNGKIMLKTTSVQRITKGNIITPKVDTAWLNMSIGLSFMSDRFINTKKEADSAKVLGYLAAHNKLYKRDAYYSNARLNLIQLVRSNTAAFLYDSLLVRTPNHFLAGNISALFNKSYKLLYTNADSAYKVIRYFYKDNMFDYWLHSSYAQFFISSANKSIPIKLNSYLLLEKLHQDKSPIMQQKVNAMYLWIKADQQKQNADLLKGWAAQFNKLDDLYMKNGNGGRYGLLIYDILLRAGQVNTANILLEKVIENLTRYQADTLYKDRFAVRNLLAHAYYISYRDALLTDSVKALDYLAKAAFYSPSSAKEKVNSSYSDRTFLNSKESYSDDYINKLFERGDNDQALKIFAHHINADLENLSKTQTMFETRFPNKSFKAFFTDKVVAEWANAPGFTLMGIDDKEHKLSNYKGKCLLTDFWGTWCGPCRDEMPNVNAFNNEVNEGKHAGIAFLSIACKDNIIAVKKYLKDNSFSIPVAMGTESLTSNYKIEGYPSKILIAPNGKMITTGFGADWRKIVAEVTRLYVAE